MPRYNRMNYVHDEHKNDGLDLDEKNSTDDNDELIDDDILDDVLDDGDDKLKTDKESDKKSDKDGDTKQPAPDEQQLANMVLVVWALLIIGIIVFVAGTVVKKRSSTTEVKYMSTASGMYNLSSIVAEEDTWSDEIIVQKKVQSNGNTVSFYIVGEASNYGKIIYIPVSYEEFNSVNDGDSVSFTFSRLNIENEENILIRSWNKNG